MTLVSMLWDPDWCFIAMTATERCLPSLQPLLLRHVDLCPKRLLGKRVSETGGVGSQKNLPRGRTAVGRLGAGVWRPGEGSASVVRWGTGAGDGAWPAEVLWGELSGRRWDRAPWEWTARRGAGGRPFEEQLEWRTFPQVEQALPAYLQVLKVRQTRVHVVTEKTGVLIPRVTVL